MLKQFDKKADEYVNIFQQILLTIKYEYFIILTTFSAYRPDDDYLNIRRAFWLTVIICTICLCTILFIISSIKYILT